MLLFPILPFATRHAFKSTQPLPVTSFPPHSPGDWGDLPPVAVDNLLLAPPRSLLQPLLPSLWDHDDLVHDGTAPGGVCGGVWNGIAFVLAVAMIYSETTRRCFSGGQPRNAWPSSSLYIFSFLISTACSWVRQVNCFFWSILDSGAHVPAIVQAVAIIGALIVALAVFACLAMNACMFRVNRGRHRVVTYPSVLHAAQIRV